MFIAVIYVWTLKYEILVALTFKSCVGFYISLGPNFKVEVGSCMIAFFNIWTSKILLDLIRFPLKIVDLVKSIKCCFGGGGKEEKLPDFLSFSLRIIISLMGD